MSRRVILLCALALAATTAFACATAQAAILPKKSAHGIASAGLTDGHVVWFQRNWAVKRFGKYRAIAPGAGEVWARGLGAAAPTKIFTPAAGERVIGFKAGANFIAIGLETESGERRPTSVIKLVRSGESWQRTTVTQQSDALNGGDCGSRVTLVDVRANGSVLVNEVHDVGLDGACAMLRREAKLREFATPEDVIDRVGTRSGWATSTAGIDLPATLRGSGDWYVQLNGSDSGSSYTVRNIVDGQRKPIATDDVYAVKLETTSGGQMLARNSYYSLSPQTVLFPAIADPTAPKPLGRKGWVSWMHACGDRIIDISRRARKGKVWLLYLRDANGVVTRKVNTRIPRGTLFDTCDQNAVVLHKPLRKGKARQWIIPLG